jgi:hypothetical protein
MSQVLFTVIDGTLVNLAKVNSIEKAITAPGQVIVSFENNQKLVLNGTVETVLMKIGGSRDDSDKKPRS